MGQTTAAGGVLEWVCLDVGETLVDETRVWSTWADVLGVPSLTLQAVLGGVIARGADHAEMFPLVGVPDWRSRAAEVEAAYGRFRADDLYPDARAARSLGSAAGRPQGRRLARDRQPGRTRPLPGCKDVML